MGEGQGQGELGPHALREFLHLLVQGQTEGRGQLPKQPLVPLLVEGGYGPLGVPEADVSVLTPVQSKRRFSTKRLTIPYLQEP